ncbi:GNAT family N-acetyltransferase [Muriicola sp.]|uniref:GNAT family N-acetyltransferase n=1 Tax=Muriicola sp. TaxID=2020856 RepID=UPI003C7885ED
MKIEVKTYNELSREELYALLQLRAEVFVVEQNCVYQDIDGLDSKAVHVLGTVNNILCAYTRLFKAGDYFKLPSIGRVVVSKKERKHKYGKQIMQASVDFIHTKWKEPQIALSAQVYLVKFYNELGFYEEGEEYLEDDIPHIKMIRDTHR